MHIQYYVGQFVTIIILHIHITYISSLVQKSKYTKKNVLLPIFGKCRYITEYSSPEHRVAGLEPK